jgi:hypothetical protein
MGLKELGCEDVDWIRLTADWIQWRTLVNTVMRRRDAMKCDCQLLKENSAPWNYAYFSAGLIGGCVKFQLLQAGNSKLPNEDFTEGGCLVEYCAV